MKNQVIRFVESEIQSGNEVIISTCGNGGAGLTLISDIMLVHELKEMDYVGSNQPAEDIENYEDYDPEAYNVHRFNGKNGFYILVATYGINASKPVEDINNLSDTIMKTFTKNQIIEIGHKLANAGIVLKYAPRSHSHNAFSLFPQTSAQYEWLKKDCGTTLNNVILYTADEVLNVCPELSGVVTPTKSGKFCRINISL